MLGIQYLKANPTQHVIHFARGKRKREGIGLSFFYYKPVSTIAIVPVSSVDVPFIFNQMTTDFQPVTVQGQLTYRITNPVRVAEILDYTVEADEYTSDDPEKLDQRLVNLAQVLTRAELDTLDLRSALRASDQVAESVFAKLAQSEAVQALGVAVLTLSVLAIKPVPEMSRALEAEAREMLLKQADDAIYLRRNAAIEQERTIKENELNTEIAVEQKQRQIRETRAAADLAVEAKEQELRESQLAGQIQLEEERKKFIAANSDNAREQADAQAYAVKAALQPLVELPDDVLQALTTQTTEPRLMVAKALSQLAQNASKIGNLNISPDLLESLLENR